MTVTTVNPKGQVTIPEPLRAKYGFPPGTRVIWIERGGDLIPRPQVPPPMLRGFLAARQGERRLTTAILEDRRESRAREDA